MAKKVVLAKKPSLLKKLADANLGRQKAPSWYDKIQPDLQKELDEVKASFQRGEQLAGALPLGRWIVEQCKIPSHPTTIARWLRTP